LAGLLVGPYPYKNGKQQNDRCDDICEPDTRHDRDHHENYGEDKFANRDTL